jgi:uncharacterized membrane protein
MPPSPQPSTLLLPPLPSKKLVQTILVTAFIGFADSAYLTAQHYFALPLPCSITHGCEKVLTSVYSMVGPIPLAAFGIAFYLFVFFLALDILTTTQMSLGRLRLLTIATIIGFLMSVIFESMQAFLIHAFCQYCALSALASTVLAICGVWLYRTASSSFSK